MHHRQIGLGLVLLMVFAVYASSARLMLLHDDAINAIWMRGYSLLSIFGADYAAGGAAARPLSNALWILTRDLFGWYHPPIIHMWNVWLHVLNVALAGSLAARMGWRLGLGGLLFPISVALIFGLFPLTYQSVIWAGAIYHPVMLAFGLSAIHTSLTAITANKRRSTALWLLSILLILCTCLSHEAGFLFGMLILVIHAVLARMNKQGVPAGAMIVAAVGLGYAALNRVLATQAGANITGLRPFSEIAANAIYFMQAMITWPVIVLRPVVGLSESSSLLIVTLFIGSVTLMLFALWRWHLIWLGALSVLWWGMMASLPILVLDAPYVRFGPRLLYSASVGIALLWGAFIAGAVHRIPQPIGKTVVLGIAGVLLAWGVPFIHTRMAETERLSQAINAISNDLRQTKPAARALFVNMPWWNAPANPSFLIGAEGMPIYQHEGAPAWTWIAANSAVQRETAYVQHPASLTQDPDWLYGQPGEAVDDAALRERMLAANAVYAFDYDAPGLRVKRVARIEPAQQPVPVDYIAMLANGDARYYITHAEARQCNGDIVLDVGWQRAGDGPQPLGVFVHGIDAQGAQAITADKDLLNGVLSLEQLPPALAVNERRIIPLPAGAPAVTSINLGAYRRSDVARLPARRPDGARFDSDQVNVPIDDLSTACE